MEADTVYRTGIYLQGDPVPIMTDLTTEQVLAALMDVEEAQHWLDSRSGFARLPLTEGRGDVLIRPRSVSAIMPTEDDDG
jgi:hypothetical protein